MQYHIKHLGKIAVAMCAVILGVLTILLFFEYRFFHDQARKMMELKEEYREYTQAVKKVLNEYNAMKEQAEGIETCLNEEQEEQKESFLTVNRELGYLKQCMIDYMHEQNLETALKRVDLNDWLDYTDQVMIAKTPAKKRKKGKVSAIQAKKTKRRHPFMLDKSQAPTDLTLAWPIDRTNFWLSSFYGPRRKPDRSWGFHYGIDMAACRGTPVKAAEQGIIIESGFHKGYGNTIVVSHNQKYKTRYAHLDKILVHVGQKIGRGDLIGKVGSTGKVHSKRGKDASHLHFEVYSFGKQVNPLYFFI